MGGIRIGYLIPQFPGQTHIFFWREIEELWRLGAEVEIVSTRPPPPGLISHSWSAQAIARTTYLGRLTVTGFLAAPPRLALVLWAEAGADGFLGDLILCADPARRLARLCAERRITHLHVHSCGRAALVAALARAGFGGVPYSLTLHGPLADYGPG